MDACPKIDYVINCAGANFGERKITKDGHEITWAVNHLAPFLLNSLLLERLKENGKAKKLKLEQIGYFVLHSQKTLMVLPGNFDKYH